MSDVFAELARAEGVPSALAGARDAIDVVIRDRGLRRSTPEHTARSLLMGAAASATLEGDAVDPDALAAGGGGATARASLRLSGELLGLVPTWNAAPLQAIARMHALAAAGSVTDVDLGRPARPEGVRRLADLVRVVGSATDAPALAVAALVHAEVLAAGAFRSHNGVVARACERLVLVAKGVDPASVTVPEAGHAAAPRDYAAAVEAYLADPREGSHRWLLYAAESFVRGAEASPLGR